MANKVEVNSNPAIIFNCHYNGLSIIQDLGRAGIECIAMDATRSIGTYSRYARYNKCHNPTSNESRFIEDLYNLCANMDTKPVLFPTNDNWAIPIAKHKSILSEVSIPCVADWETVKLIVNKQEFYDLGQRNSYLTPKTWTHESVIDIDDRYFPIAAKPISRRTSSDQDLTDLLDAMDRLRLTVLKNKEDLVKFISCEQDYVNHLVFQEYIAGQSDCMYTVGIYADNNHEILGLFTGRKVRGYPADIGDCIVGENYIIPDHILNHTARIVKEIKYSGIAEFEYKQDSITGEFRLIEINPRSWSWIGITAASGQSLPMTAYLDLTGQVTPEPSRTQLPSGTVRYAKILQDLGNSLFQYRLTYPDWAKSPLEWIKDYQTASKIVMAEFQTDDPGVALMAVAQSVREAMRRR